MNRYDYERLKAKVAVARAAVVEAKDDAEALLGTIRDEASEWDEEKVAYYLTTVFEQLVTAQIKLNSVGYDLNEIDRK